MYSHLHSPQNLRSSATIGCKTVFLSYSVYTKPGYEPGASRLGRALYHVVLRAFSPLQISQRSITIQNRPTSFCRDFTVCDVVPGGIRPAKIISHPTTSELTWPGSLP